MTGRLTVGGEKISKSGRSVDPLELLARRGADPLRYWLLRHVRADRDGDFDETRFALAHDAELANGLGNLAGRVAGAAARIAGGAIPEAGAEHEGTAELRARALALPGEVDAAFARFAVDEALSAVFGLVDAANRFLTREAPWAAPPARGRAALRSALEALGAVAVELPPFLPGTSAALREQLGVPPGQARAGWNVLAPGRALAPGKALFPRIGR